MLKGFKCLLLIAVTSVVSQVCAFANDAKDHPAISRMPDAVIKNYRQLEYDEMQILLSKPYKKNRKWIADETQIVGGQLTYIHYALPKKYSPLQTFRNYQKLAQRQGMQILFSCDRPCPNANLGSMDELIKNANDFYINGSKQNQYMVAQKNGLYFFVFVNELSNKTNVFQFVIEEQAMNDGLLTGMAASLATDGKMDLYGLYFDSGKSSLKSKSKTELAELAKVLSDYPELNLDIVGHTDNVGSSSSNKSLSNARAASVLQALVNDYGIAEGRLDSLGRGEARPIASNDNADGRAKNRRVEIVALNPEVIDQVTASSQGQTTGNDVSGGENSSEQSSNELDTILDNAEKVSKIGSALKSLF